MQSRLVAPGDETECAGKVTQDQQAVSIYAPSTSLLCCRRRVTVLLHHHHHHHLPRLYCYCIENKETPSVAQCCCRSSLSSRPSCSTHPPKLVGSLDRPSVASEFRVSRSAPVLTLDLSATLPGYHKHIAQTIRASDDSSIFPASTDSQFTPLPHSQAHSRCAL